MFEENWKKQNVSGNNVEEFVRKRQKFAHAAKKKSNKLYEILIPRDNHQPGVLDAPSGIFQVIDYCYLSSNEPSKPLFGNVSGNCLTSDELKNYLSQMEFLKFVLNLDARQGGICVEEKSWALLSEDKDVGWFYLLLRVITNVSMHSTAQFIFYFDSAQDDFDGRLRFMRIDDESYGLLSSVLKNTTRGGQGGFEI